LVSAYEALAYYPPVEHFLYALWAYRLSASETTPT
jgi:hypothetical protein